MKKVWSLLLVLAVLLAAVPAFSEELSEEEAVIAAEFSTDSLTVGNTTQLKGCFFTDMWGSCTSDIDVRLLLHDYSPVKWENETGGYATDDRVVTGIAATADGEGNRTYYISLSEKLYFSDGTQITAEDYVFSILLSLCPEIREIGGQNATNPYIIGSDEYSSGETEVLKGVSIMSDTLFSISVKAEYFPFFYELALLDFLPYPMHVLAPGCSIAQTENGVSIEGGFTAELLTRTILDEETGYLSHPSVVSGPYTLTSFDGVTAEFEANPYYIGNDEGYTPRITYLTYTLADNGDMAEKLENGSFGLINKAVSASAIDECIALVREGFKMTNYPRTGLSMVHFCCEKTAVGNVAVRQAIAYCFDRDGLVSDVVGYYGLRTDGYYGLGQWTYQIISGTLEPELAAPGENASAEEQEQYDKQLEEFESLSMDEVETYDQDLAKATELLVNDGWTLNEEGEEFVAGEDTVRCKKVDDTLVKLDLTLAYLEGSAAEESLLENLVEPLSQVGIRVTMVPTEANTLMDMYYREIERDCDMIYMATNFSPVYDPSAYVNPDDAETGNANRTAIADEELYELAVEMRETEPGDLLTYCQRFIEFQKRYMEVLPSIPVYTDVYFDFYVPGLVEYKVNQNIGWSEAIVSARLDAEAQVFGLDVYAEEDEPEDEEFEDEELEDGEEIFEE